MKNTVTLPALFVFLIFPLIAFSQSAVLDNYIQEALKNNLSIKGEQLKRNKQLVRVAQAKKNWMPSVDVDATYLFSEGGRTILFPIGDLFNPVYGTLNELTQSDQFPTGLKNEEIALTPNNFLDLQLKITQPLINSSIKYNQRIQEALVQLNEVDVEIQEKEITFQTSTAYYNYLKSIEGFKILDETEVLLNDLLTINRKLVKYNKATGEVISDIEYQLANLESQRAGLAEQQAIAKTYFNIIVNRATGSEIEIDQSIIADLKIETLALETLVEEAKQKRSEFKKITIAKDVNVLNRDRIDKEKLPTLGVTGAVGLQTEAFNFDSGGPIYTLGFGAAVNLFDGGRRKKRIEEILVDQQILDNNKVQLEQQIEIQLTQIYFALQTLNSKLQADYAASKSAQKTYDIIKSKYENDKAILLQVTDAQNKLVTSKLRQVITKYDYLLKVAELERAKE